MRSYDQHFLSVRRTIEMGNAHIAKAFASRARDRATIEAMRRDLEEMYKALREYDGI